MCEREREREKPAGERRKKEIGVCVLERERDVQINSLLVLTETGCLIFCFPKRNEQRI